MLRDDYLMRQVEQMGRAVAQVMALCRKESYEEALDEARQALGDALGPRARLVDSVDAASAVALIGAPELVVGVAALLAEEARALAGQGLQEDAVERRARAAALLRQLPGLDDGGRELLDELTDEGVE